MRPLLLALTGVCALLLQGCYLAPSPNARQGSIDATSWNLRAQRMPLSGEWTFFRQQLVNPSDSLRTEELAHFPQVWNLDKANDEGIEFGTYQLRVTVADNLDSLALALPQMYCSYTLWVNEKLVASNGQPGTSRETTRPQWLPQTVVFSVPAERFTLTLQIANFYHDKGGSREAIHLGSPELMTRLRTMATVGTWMESGMLTLLGLAFVVLFIIKKKQVILLFSMVCLVWGVRSVFSNLYLAIDQFPDLNWHFMIRIEYLTLYLTTAFTVLYVHQLFPREASKLITGVLLVANVIFIIPTLLSEAITFTRYLQLYLVTSGVTIFYCITIVIRAWVNDRHGTSYLLGSMLMAAGIFAYDILAYEGLFIFNDLIIALGYTVIFLLMAPALLMKIQAIGSKATGGVLTYNDLYKKD